MSRNLELILTLIGDITLLCLGFIISWHAASINYSIISWHAITANIILLIFWLFLFQSYDLYRSRSEIQLMNELFKLFKLIGAGLLIILMLSYLFNINFIKAKGFIPSYIAIFGFLVLWRFLWRGIVGEYIKPRKKNVIIFENGDQIENLNGFKILKNIKFNELNSSNLKVLFNEPVIEGVVINSNGTSKEKVVNIVSQLAETNYEIYISPRLYPILYRYFLMKRAGETPYLKVMFHPLSNWDRFLKRTFDIILSLISLIILAPILSFIAITIKIDSPGSVFYKQKRIGLREKKYILYKFRSMIIDAERHTGPVWASHADRRITRIGKVLRPLRFDELPQLINVLKGEMSFVGPRPERPHFVDIFKNKIPLYSLRFCVHPGITGLAQVKHPYDTSIDDVKKKLEYDLKYINGLTWQLDLKIFLKTVLTVLKREGAH